MSQTELIMIDDTDSGIQYTGDWVADKGSVDNLGNYGAPYMSTNHYIKGTGSFSYTFSGTYVGIFGTTLTGTDPVRTCTVDGTVIPNNNIGAAENWFMHCQVNGLADGKHTIVVTVPTANSNGYWFDYLMYIPSASVSRTNAVVTYLVGDPSFQFGTGWGQMSPGYAATSNGAVFNMPFAGQSLTWLGYYLSQNPFAATTATWSVDGSSPVTFSLNGVGAQSAGAEFNQRFFTTGVLSAGEHNLKVVYNGNSGTSPLSIYQVIVQNGNTAGVNIGGISSSSSSGGGGGSGATTAGATASNAASTAAGSTAGFTAGAAQASVVVTIGSGASAVTVTVAANSSTATQGLPGILGSSATVTRSSPVSSSSSSTAGSGTSSNGAVDASGAKVNGSHSHIGAIVGGVVAFLAILLLLLLVLFLRRKRSKQRARGPQTSEASVVEPFIDPPSSQPAATAEVAPTEFSRSVSNFTPSPFLPSQGYIDEKRQPTTSHAQNPSLSTFSSPSTNGRPESEIIMVHEDSGVRLPLAQSSRPGPVIVEMPPTYSAT